MSADFGTFTPAERRAAVVAITAAMIQAGAIPKSFPPNRDGEAKPVQAHQKQFALAVWAKRQVENLEGATKPRDDTAPQASAEQEGAGDDTPF